MRITLDPGAICPKRAHLTDAGLDLYSLHDAIIPGNDTAVLETGVHVEMPPCTFGLITARSSWERHGVIINSKVDEGYTGAIKIIAINTSPNELRVKRGERIAQLIVCYCSYAPLEIIEALPETERGNDGFGSTGR